SPRFFSIRNLPPLGTFHYRLHVDLDAPVLCAAALGSVARDRHALALADDAEPHFLDAFRLQVLGHRASAPFREALVELRTADVEQAGKYESLQAISFQEYSARTSFAPSTMARILASATSRGRYFMPQSGATITSSGFTYFSALCSRCATLCGVSTVMSERSI